MSQKPITAVILGAGHRSLIYGDVSLSHPDILKIVGVVDINPQKADFAAKRYGVDPSRVFYSVDELVKCGKIADIVINGTMDAYSSIISNNMNVVQKFIAIAAIVITIPSLFFDAYGMNIEGVPFEHSRYAFIIIILAATIASMIVYQYFKHKKMF